MIYSRHEKKSVGVISITRITVRSLPRVGQGAPGGCITTGHGITPGERQSRAFRLATLWRNRKITKAGTAGFIA
jgi:hypothetical protein